MQLMVQQLGGVVEAATGKAEYGKAPLEVDDPTDLLTNVDNGSTMWMSHGDSVKALPDGFVRLAHTANTPEAAGLSDSAAPNADRGDRATLAGGGAGGADTCLSSPQPRHRRRM